MKVIMECPNPRIAINLDSMEAISLWRELENDREIYGPLSNELQHLHTLLSGMVLNLMPQVKIVEE